MSNSYVNVYLIGIEKIIIIKFYCDFFCQMAAIKACFGPFIINDYLPQTFDQKHFKRFQILSGFPSENIF